MGKRKNIDVENLKKIFSIQLEKNLLSMHYMEFNNFEDEKYYCQSNVNNLDLDFFYEYGY